ncbi:MAG: glycerol-3-phosphate dehydrogenase/oxidase [Microthrixaceae bacterium]
MTAPSALDARTRDEWFRRVQATTYDLLVIGAGITGAGIARDAALRGLSVALVEAGDLACGTSSRSSKMIHGGLRYLAQGDVGLVKEAARERQVLRRVAPHLARIDQFMMPLSRSGLATMRAGLVAFERLGKVPKGERHEVLSTAELRRREPLVDADRYAGAVAYPEFLTNDARLTLANVRSAVEAGADVLTYAPVTTIVVSGGRAVAAECTGALPGESLSATVRARQIVNAAGPWVDAVRALEDDAAPPRLMLTKGVHLVVPHERLPVAHTVLTLGADKRPVFAVPSGEVTYLGTTDTRYDAADLWPGVTRADVDYLSGAMGNTFVGPRLGTEDLVTTWSGIRPLIAQEGKKPSEISRKDEVWVGPHGIRSIAGGKLTAYRAMAERIVDDVVAELGDSARLCATKDQPLVGGDVQPSGAAEPDGGGRLYELYGSEAAEVVADGGDVAAEVRQAVCREGALRLEDYWVRRGARAWFTQQPVGGSLDAAAAEMGSLLGWDDARRQAEVARCRGIHQRSLTFADTVEDSPTV